MKLISTYVEGIAQPKGSVSAFPISRGGKTSTVVVYPPKTREWEALVAERVSESAEVEQIDDACKLKVTFYMPRPKTSKRATPSVRPDLDKLVRCIGDALEKSKVIRSDSRIVEITAKKVYENARRKPGVMIVLERKETK